VGHIAAYKFFANLIIASALGRGKVATASRRTAILIVVMMAVAVYSPLGDSHNHWSVDAESNQRFSRHSYSFASGNNLNASSGGGAGRSSNRRAFPTSGDCADDCSEKRSTTHVFSRPTVLSNTLASARFYPLGIGVKRVPLSVHGHRFKVEDQIAIGSGSDDHFYLRPPGNRQSAVPAANISVNGSSVDAVIPTIVVDVFISTNR
jgi:hypothetical protein